MSQTVRDHMQAMLDHHGIWNGNDLLVPPQVMREWVENLDLHAGCVLPVAEVAALRELVEAVRRWRASLRAMNLALDGDPIVAAEQFSALLDEWNVIPNVLLRALSACEQAAAVRVGGGGEG